MESIPLILFTNEHFGIQLKRERKNKKLKQIEVASIIGCKSSNICHFEKGDNTFGNGNIQTVFNYARALGYNEVTFKL